MAYTALLCSTLVPGLPTTSDHAPDSERWPGGKDEPAGSGLVVRGLTLIALLLDRLCLQEVLWLSCGHSVQREAQASRFHPRRHARSSLQSQPPGSRSARLGRRTHGAMRQTCSV